MVDAQTEPKVCLGMGCSEIDPQEFVSGESELTAVEDDIRICNERGEGCIRIIGRATVETAVEEIENA